MRIADVPGTMQRIGPAAATDSEHLIPDLPWEKFACF
jgi:hypothetical protein